MTRIRVLFFLFLCALMPFGCVKDKTASVDYIIRLKWHQSHSDSNFDDALIGLTWAFSHVGAKNTAALYLMPITENIISVNIRELGFTSNAEKLLEQLNRLLIDSEEYSYNAGIDVGRYISLLIGAPEHYYALTKMPLTLSELLANYDLSPSVGYVDNSAISSKHRIIKFSEQAGLNQLFVAEETHPETGEVLEFETVDLLPNGQLRFGIFDANGDRESVANNLNSVAGKPAKCMWCHESGIQPLFEPQSDFDGYLDYVIFRDTLVHFRNALLAKQSTLFDGVDFSKFAEHIQMELLYISFMEPSIARLSSEWNLSISNLEKLLEGQQTHENEEFPFLGELYDRNSIEALAPFKSIQVSSEVREQSEIEVNYLGP